MSSKGEGLPSARCPRCGREAARLTGGVCSRCLVETREILRPPTVQLAICRDCFSYRHGTGWREGGGTLEETVLRAVREGLLEGTRFTELALSASGEPGGPRITGMKIDSLRVARGRVGVEATARVEGLLPGGETVNLALVPKVSLQRTLCRACGLRRSDFYEAILQVRADGRGPGQEELEAVDSIVLRRAREASPTSLNYVAKAMDRKEGRDYFLASVAFSRELAKEVLSALGGSQVESRKLVGVEKGTGKRLYKFTILARLPRLRPGDVVEAEGDLRAVAQQSGRKATLVDLQGRRTVHDEGGRKRLPLVSRREDVGEALVLEVRPDGIQILDPRSNQTFDLDARPEGASVGRKVRIIWREDAPELVPVLPEEEI